MAQFGALLLESGLIGRLLIGQCQPLPILLLEAPGLAEQGGGLPPDGSVQQVSADLVVGTHPFAPEAISICAEAAVVGVAARMVFACGRADRLAIERVAALSTTHQPLQEVPRAAQALSGMAAILLQLLLDQCKHCGVHQRRYRNVQPVLGRRISVAPRPTRLEWPPALGPHA